MQNSHLQLLQDEQQAQHQRQKGLLEEELARLKQALQQSNRNLELSRNGAEVRSRECTIKQTTVNTQVLCCILQFACSAWDRQCINVFANANLYNAAFVNIGRRVELNTAPEGVFKHSTPSKSVADCLRVQFIGCSIDVGAQDLRYTW